MNEDTKQKKIAMFMSDFEVEMAKLDFEESKLLEEYSQKIDDYKMERIKNYINDEREL